MILRLLGTLALTIPFLTSGCATKGPMMKNYPEARSGISLALTSIFVDDPTKAHKFYTEVLGFQSKQFEPEAYIAIVVAVDDPNGPAILLEPRGMGFGKNFQESAYKAGLPIVIMEISDLEHSMEELKAKGVKFRPELDKEAWGITNMFEDTCGNLIMLQERE